MREIEVRELPYLPLGHQGENEAQRIVWRGLADSWARLYGEGGFALTVLREGDSAPYPASLKSENGDVIWTLSNADTAKAGEGMAELTYTVGGAIAKSRTWRTVVEPSLSANGTTEPPPAYQSWVDEVLRAAADVETAVSKMPYVDETTGNWFKWDATAGAFADTGVAATGPTGPKGETGSGFKVLGYYGTKAALDAAQKATAAAGDAYGVGTAEPYDIYIFDGITGEFINNGPLQGAKGDTGPEGPQGPKGDKGDKGDKGEPGGGGGQPAVEIDLSDSFTMDETCLWTTLLNLSHDSDAAMKIKQAALAGNAKVTVKIKVSSSAEPDRVTLRMVGSQYTDAELGERYNLTGTAVLLGIAPIDVMLGAYGGDPPAYVLGSLRPQQQSEPLAEVDLSDKITLSPEDLFTSFASLGNDKSVGEKIKQAALERRAYVTVMFKSVDGASEKVTLQMFGTQSALKDGTPAYALTGTYVFSGMLPMDIMIGTIIYETNCTVVKRIESLGQKPIYDPVDKPDTTPDGAFLRWSSEQKKWVAETVPAAEGGSF